MAYYAVLKVIDVEINKEIYTKLYEPKDFALAESELYVLILVTELMLDRRVEFYYYGENNEVIEKRMFPYPNDDFIMLGE